MDQVCAIHNFFEGLNIRIDADVPKTSSIINTVVCAAALHDIKYRKDSLCIINRQVLYHVQMMKMIRQILLFLFFLIWDSQGFVPSFSTSAFSNLYHPRDHERRQERALPVLQGWWWDVKSNLPALEPSREEEETTKNSVVEDEIKALEKQVLYSTQAELDLLYAKRALTAADTDTTTAMAPQWSIALAGGASAGFFVFILTQNIILGAVATLFIGIVASRDPVHEDDPAGAVARTVGRAALQGVQAAKPKAKALARAAWTGDEEILVLQQQVADLKQQQSALRAQNDALATWKRRRIWVDENLSSYNLQDLKELARNNQLPVGGTKAQLLMRLVEANVITPD